MADEDPLTKEDVCVLSMTVRSGGGDKQPGGAGDQFEVPVKDAMDLAEQEEQNNQDDPEAPEQWKEVARTIKPLELEGGTEVDRIIRSTFEKPSGKRIELVFAEAQPGVDADSITTEA